MHTTVIDPIMAMALQSSEKNKRTQVHFESTLHTYLKQLLTNQLIEQKTSLIVVSSASEMERIPKLLATLQLNQYCKLLDVQSTLNEIEISKIRARAKSKKSEKDKLDFLALAKKKTNAAKQIASFYNKREKQKKGGHTLSSLVHYPKTPSYRTSLKYALDHLNLEENDLFYFRMKTFLKTAFTLYNQEFNVLDKLQLDFTKEYLSGDRSINISLEKLVARSQKLIDAFAAGIERYKNSLTSIKFDTIHTIQDVRAKAEELLDQCINFEEQFTQNDAGLISKIKSRVGKQYGERMDLTRQMDLSFELWEDRFKSCLPAIFEKYSNQVVGDHKVKLQAALQQLRISEQETKKSKSASVLSGLKQLNMHNCDLELRKVVNELMSFYNDVAFASILKIQIEDNAFSILHQLDYLKEVNQILEDALFIQNKKPEYLQWKKELLKLNYEESLVTKAFQNFVSENHPWDEVFESYYFSSVFEDAFCNGSEKSIGMIEGLEKISRQYSAKITPYLDYIFQTQLDQTSLSLKSTHAHLYATLFKKKYANDLLWQEIVQTDIYTALYPITVIPESQLSMIQAMNLTFDDCVYLNFNRYDNRDLPNLPTAEKYEYIKFPVDPHAIEYHDRQIENFELSVDYKEYLYHPKIKTNQDDFNLARSLASKLSTFDEELHFYQLEHQKVICFLPESSRRKFEVLHYDQGLKELTFNTNTNFSLVDALLNCEKNTIFITQDFALAPRKTESLQWQFYLITLLQRVGLQWKNVELQKLYHIGESELLVNKQEQELSLR